jgi:hypothetical protein
LTPPLHTTKLPKDSPHRISGKPCSKCGRQYWAGHLHDKVELPSGRELMALGAQDEDHGAFAMWVVGEKAQQLLARRKWKGLSVVRGYYGKDAPFWKAAEERRKAARARSRIK